MFLSDETNHSKTIGYQEYTHKVKKINPFKIICSFSLIKFRWFNRDDFFKATLPNIYIST